MTSTNPSEPSDEGVVTHEGARLLLSRGVFSQALARNLPRYIDRQEAVQAELARVKLDFANACDVGRRLESQLTEARAELERAKVERDTWKHNYECEVAEAERIKARYGARPGEYFAEFIDRIAATPPSPPEAKPAEPHIQTSPFRQVAEASAKPVGPDPRLADALANPPGPRHARLVEEPAEGSEVERPRRWCNKCPHLLVVHNEHGFCKACECGGYIDQSPAQEQPASPRLGGPVDALRAEIVAALRKVEADEACGGKLNKVADELERR